METLKVNIEKKLLAEIQKLSEFYGLSLDKTIELMAETHIRDFTRVENATSQIADKDIEFLFNDYPDSKHPNPNNMAKIIPLF